MPETTEVPVKVVDDHPIYHAIWNEDKELVGQMIRKDPSVLSISAHRWDGTPLIFAILSAENDLESGDELALHIIEHANKEFWDCTTQTPTTNFGCKGMTPLLAACWAEQPSVVKKLAEKGVDLTEMNPENEHTPLALAVVRPSPKGKEILQYLLTFPAVRETLADLIPGDRGPYASVLGEACDATHPSPEVIRILLDAGADASFPGGSESPLHIVRRDRGQVSANWNRDVKSRIAKYNAMEALLQSSIDESIRARWLFRARFLGDAALAIKAAQAEAANKRDMEENERRQKVLDATPRCLEERVRTAQPLPLVSFEMSPAMAYVPTRSACGEYWAWESDDVTAFFAIMDAPHVLDKVVTELPDDLFGDLMEMMVPPGDFAWRGEKLGKFLERADK